MRARQFISSLLYLMKAGHVALKCTMIVQVIKGKQLPWYAITYEGRAKLIQLGREIKTIADFGRSYKCISASRGYYTLEDWTSFIETFSDLLLRHEDILHPQVSSYP